MVYPPGNAEKPQGNPWGSLALTLNCQRMPVWSIRQQVHVLSGGANPHLPIEHAQHEAYAGSAAFSRIFLTAALSRFTGGPGRPA